MRLNNYINYLLVLYTFAFSISIAVANIILGLILVLWIIEGNFKNKLIELKKNKVLIVFFLLITTILISTILSPEYNQGFLINDRINNEFGFIKRFFWLSIFYITLASTAKKKTVPLMVNSFLIAMFINELISYSIYFQLIDISYFKKIGLIYSRASHIDPSPMNHSFYSIYLSVTIMLLIYKFFHTEKGYILKIWIIMFILSASANLFVNSGRTGQLAILISLFVFFIIYFRKKRKQLVVALLITLIMPLIAYKYSPNFHTRVNRSYNSLNMILNNNYCSSWGQRVGMNISSYKYLTDNYKNFILGAGAGIAKKEYHKFTKHHYPEIYKCIKHDRTLHNQYLQLWIDGGIFSLILLMYLFYILLKLNRRNLYLNSALLSIFVFSFISDVMIYYSKTLMLFFFVMIVIQYYNEESHENCKTDAV